MNNNFTAMAQATTQMATLAFTVMTVNIFSSALGVMLGATLGEAALAEVAKITPTEEAIAELREAYGNRIVDRAIQEAPDKDILTIARKVEVLVKADMVSKYGAWASDVAMKAAPPGDLRTAREVAATLSGQGVTPATPAHKVEDTAQRATHKALAGRKPGKPTKDTKTGIIYGSKYAAGKVIATEYGLDPKDTHVYYEIMKRDPGRLVDVE